MQILSNTIQINKESILNTDIETYLKSKTINLLRWAIVDVSEDNYTIDYTYSTK